MSFTQCDSWALELLGEGHGRSGGVKDGQGLRWDGNCSVSAVMLWKVSFQQQISVLYISGYGDLHPPSSDAQRHPDTFNILVDLRKKRIWMRMAYSGLFLSMIGVLRLDQRSYRMLVEEARDVGRPGWIERVSATDSPVS
ncbi:uncharacterized protein BO80DRAFT_437582 [Aspergillus ibericus CBS 121593]|uniref:Uncharacterized protein n=1 Tax=Aspergillus ibericus CBS 121593 TaxID=1448316 RepID=A0A395GUF2_9EURO|nr:hypothetical protein BO80DRAFT_437582 [Aspergillus ibericus CBS 121593]RAK97733.1 hypothetical protein BO80DRAFT_437582 [Aspergillus ibericus CBS 121593]